MGALDGLVAVVAGGTGSVGERIVEAFLGAGATVVVPAADAGRLDRLAGRLPRGTRERLVPVVCDAGTAEGVAHVRDAAEARGGADAVVAALGGWWQGPPLTALDPDAWRRMVTRPLASHFALARAFLPGMIRRGRGTYTQVNGPAAETPFAGAGPVSVAAAGQLMLGRALIAELEGTGVRCFELVLGRVAPRGHPGGADRLDAAEVGAFAARLAAAEGAGRVYHLRHSGALHEADGL